jgi:pSer/pThr/pTyr-binding forkhead associated (FHA) protein
MAPQPYQLVIRSGPNVGKVFDLTMNEYTIGRDISNDIVINDAEVSRQHARLTLQGENFVLEDNGSTNGTFVDGQRIMGPHVLRPGEVILLGENVTLGFEPVAYDPNATMVSGGAFEPEPSTVGTFTTPSEPEPQPYRDQQPFQEPPAFTGTVPPGPVADYPAPPKKSNRNAIMVGCGCLLLVCLCCAALGFGFDYLDLYCQAPFNEIPFMCP